MSAIDTAKAVLAKASLIDQNIATPDLGIAVAWSEILGDVDRGDALAAVTEHYTRPDARRIMPGDVLAGVRKIRAERIRAASSALLEPVDVDPNDVTAYLEAGRRRRRAIAAGESLAAEHEHPKRDVAALVADTARKLPKMPRGESAPLGSTEDQPATEENR